jgi:hypothetical protein
MSKNINQVFQTKPITSNVSTDLMYFGQSPYGATNDAAMTYANFAAQFVGAGGAVTSISGTPNQVIASASTGAVTLSLPQSIATTSSPTFSIITASNKFLAGATTFPLPVIQNSTVGPIGGSGINAVFTYNNATDFSNFFGYKSASNTIGVYSAISNPEPILSLTGLGDDGTQFTVSGAIKLFSSGAVSTGIVPSSWIFQTANTSGVLTTGMTLSNAQVLTLANALPIGSGGTGITSFGTGVATALGQNVNGSGAISLTTSPTFVTPTLGAASATSINFSSTSGIIGTTTNNSAAAGSVGELIFSELLDGSGQDLQITTNTLTNMVSISLTAGDWDVWASVTFEAGGGTLVTQLVCGINTVSATMPDNAYLGTINSLTAINLNSGNWTCTPAQRRISLATTTTVYLVVKGIFTVSTLFVVGGIYARRRR